MASRITVRLPDDLREALRRAALRTRRRPSEIVRTALCEYLGFGAKSGKRTAISLRRLLGSLASDIPDLAERHRQYVLASLRRGR